VAGCCECGDEPSGSCATDFSYTAQKFTNMHQYEESRVHETAVKATGAYVCVHIPQLGVSFGKDLRKQMFSTKVQRSFLLLRGLNNITKFRV
jgi:hypothetical protein